MPISARVAREMIVVNQQYPGPTIEANWGDWWEITVQNNLDEGTSIHWHGLLQANTVIALSFTSLLVSHTWTGSLEFINVPSPLATLIHTASAQTSMGHHGTIRTSVPNTPPVFLVP